ncbi:MAG: hypothetical protein HPY60_03505 [Candidatus Methanofastidiosum sp.]|nr:hypothetical protein [Methanofastidiosum sp.]
MKKYYQSRLDPYLKNNIQEIVPSEKKENPYTNLKCSLLSELNISDSYSYFKCNYRNGIEFPKTGLCFSCPLKNFEGIWIGAEIDIKEREKYLKSQINPQWLCFGIK